jgi:long-chain acyl-CoA synthetase
MINFQEAMARLLAPSSSCPERLDRTAIIAAGSSADGTNDRQVTYGDLQTLTGRAFNEYRKEEITAGDAVLLCSPNSPELVAAIFAAWSVGATAIPVDSRLTAQEVENIARRVNAKIVYAPKITLTGFKKLNPTAFETGTAASAEELLAGVKPETLGLVILTSGTTGVPKGAVHDLGTLLDNFVEIGTVFGLEEGNRALLPLPVSHIFGIEVTLAFLCLGGSMVFADFSPMDFWQTIERLKPTLVVGVPTIYGALLGLPHPGETCKIVEFYLSGGAPLAPSLAEQFENIFGRRIVQGYGATETKITTVNKDGPVASIGRPIPSVKVEIVDGQENALPEGETGELRITAHCLMKGYLNQPDLTAEVLHGDHYHTGDIGYIKDGWVFISGRSKEMIIVAGNKVFPSEVESVLRQHPLAAEVAVVGLPHSKLGQIVKAIVVVPPGEWSSRLAQSAAEQKTAHEELKGSFRDFCAQNLKRELRPMDWEFRSSEQPLPKTHTGKIDKKQLQSVHA